MRTAPRPRPGLLLFFSGLLLGVVATASDTWPLRNEELVPDPAWQWGTLDNGLRYALRRNAQPAGHVSFRLAVQVGFAHETKSERGFAHFVEHMAFNGTTHFPGESLVTELEKHGVALGPDLSAFTFLNHTLFGLDAPSTAPAELDRWFTVLRDFADGLKFESRQVKRERGVIASETRDRESPGKRAELARRRFLYPLSPLSNSGDGDVNAADRTTLRRFYDRWYRPERMILVVAGDVDPAQLEELVRRHFSSLRARTPPPPAFDPGYFENPAGGTTGITHDPKVNGLTVELTSVLRRDGADSLTQRRQWLARNLLLYMLNVRLQHIVRNHPGQLVSLYARASLPTPYSLETVVGFNAPTPEWKFAITTLEQELRRSFEFTVSGDEIREARAALLAGYEQQMKTSRTVQSAELAGNTVQSALWEMVSSSPEDELRRAREWLPTMDSLELNRAWRSLWQEGRAQTFGYGFFPVRNGEALLNAAFSESGRHPIEAPVKQKEPPFAYTDFGPAGKVTRHEYLPDLDLHLVEFENGVRANLKRTPYEANVVHLTSRLGHGMLTMPLGQPGLGAMASATLVNGGLGRHAPEELRRILSASALALNFSCEEKAFAFTGQASPEKLGLLLQVMGAYLTDPGWNPEAVAVATAQLGIYYGDFNYSAEGIIGLNAFRILAGDDPRYSLPTAAQLKARTAEEIRQWLDPQLRAAPLEIGLVGDFDPTQAIDLLSRTLGALPARTGPPTNEPAVTLSRQPGAHPFDFTGETSRSGVEVVWPLERCDEVRFTRQTEVLCAAYGERLRQKVREDLGATYSPTVSFWQSEASPTQGYLMAYITGKPDEARRLAKLMVDIADDLSRKGATADEFQRAREPILDRSIADQKDNDYWVRHIMAKLQSQPRVREWPLTRISDLQSMTLADLSGLARSIFPAQRAIIFSASPAQSGPGRR